MLIDDILKSEGEDKRIIKSKRAIYSAFNSLLQEKSFSSIKVNDIVERSGLARSTFYSYFKSKDKLLESLCIDVFDHVFQKKLNKEQSHDFTENEYQLREKLTHILYHLRDIKEDIVNLFSGESGLIFMSYFKEYSKEAFREENIVIPSTFPEDYALDYLSGGFSNTVDYWIKNDMEESPEKMVDYFIRINNIDI